jgi:hypothetical protein
MYFLENENIKNNRAQKSLYAIPKQDNIFSIGKVISTIDTATGKPDSMGRIKVYIDSPANRGGDMNTKNLKNPDGSINPDVLPWAMPMNSMVTTQPKVGETVFIFCFDNSKPFVDRIYFGPIISEPQNLNYEGFGNDSPLKGLSIANINPNKSVYTIPEINGVFPDPQDVSIQGRYNTDITQKYNEIVIRAGKFKTSSPSNESGGNPYSFSFNSKTQAFIQLKNDVVVVKESDTTSEERGSITNIVASKINLLTHKDGAPTISLNPNDLISDLDMETILAEAHQLPFGDILLEYLKLIKNAILYHVHNGNGNPATDLNSSGNVQAIAAFKSKADDLEKNMLSKNIRIN